MKPGFVNKRFFKWFHRFTACCARKLWAPMAKCSRFKNRNRRNSAQMVDDESGQQCSESNDVVEPTAEAEAQQSNTSAVENVLKNQTQTNANAPVQNNALVKRGFEVTDKIGQGSFGSILMVRSKRHHTQMAVKVIEKYVNGRKDKNLQLSIENEKMFADVFDHPYINVYHEIIETSLRVYFVMDYFPAGTLCDYYSETPFTVESVAYEWFAQLCSALEFVHEKGYAHRDIKMDNVLLDDHRRVRLADFGLCTAIWSPHRRADSCDDSVCSMPPSGINHTTCGTSWYMSPELVNYGPYNAQLADVWALGVVLFCLLVGRFPFLPTNNLRRYYSDVNQFQLVRDCQKEGYQFLPNERERLSNEAQMIFRNIFVNESERCEIKDLKKDEWMVKEAQNAKGYE